MNYPPAIESYLGKWARQVAHPLCLEICVDGKLISISGPAEFYQICLSPGDDVGEAVPFAGDYPWDELAVLPMMTDQLGNAVNVHLLPGDQTRFIIYFDARQEMQQRAAAQQQFNEASLLSQQQKRLINELIEARSELETRRRAAEDEGRRKSEYLAAMSHDFRTPLTSIMGYAEWIKKDSEGSGPKAATIIRAAGQLLDLVNNLIDRARMDAGGISIHPTVTDLHVLVADIASLMAPLAAEKGLSFGSYIDSESSSLVVIDASRLRQILVNIVANAVKFTDQGTVSMVLSQTDGMLRIVISDTGPGIDPADQERVFHAFQRARASAAIPGAGLGLSNSRHLAELMGGQLNLSSAVGEGTSVTVEVPAVAVQEGNSANQTGPLQSEDSSALILMAEDDADIYDLVQSYLEQEGYRVIHGSDGAAAVDLALSSNPDLVVMDMNLPKLNGRQAATALREQGCTMPIVALSAAHERTAVEQALAAGCDEFVAKPMHMPDFIRTVQRLLIDARHSAVKNLT